MIRRTRLLSVALLVAAGAVLATCGSDAGTVGSPTSSGPVTSEPAGAPDVETTTPTEPTTVPSTEPTTEQTSETTTAETTEPTTAETGFGQSEADRDRMLATSWTAQRFITVGPLDEVPAGSTAGFRFLDDSTIRVDTGCNTGTGTVTFGPGGTLAVSALGLTKIACADDTESKMLALFDLDLVWSVDGDQLTIYPLTVTDVGLILVDAETVEATPTTTPTAEQAAAADRAAIVAAAVFERVAVDNSFGGQATVVEVAVVEIFGDRDENAMLTVSEDGVQLADAERAAIEAAVDPVSVRWTDDQFDPSVVAAEAAGQITAIITMSEPVVDGDSATITTGLFCGSTCGTGGTYELARQSDGSWIVTGSIGPEWVS